MISNSDACRVPRREPAPSTLSISIRAWNPSPSPSAGIETFTPNEVVDSQGPTHTFRSVLSSESFAEESAGPVGSGHVHPARKSSTPSFQPHPSLRATPEQRPRGKAQVGTWGDVGLGAENEDSVPLTRRRAGGISGGPGKR